MNQSTTPPSTARTGRRFRLGLASAVAAALVLAGTAGAGQAVAKPLKPIVKTTSDGAHIVLRADFGVDPKQAIGGVPGFSKEAFLSADVSGLIKDLAADASFSAELEVAYQIGYVADLPSQIDVTAHTPSVTLSGGLNATLSPSVSAGAGGGGGSAGSIGGNVGAEANIIPSQDFQFTIKAGGISTVSLGKYALQRPNAEFSVTGIELNAVNVVGNVTVRPVAILRVSTQSGMYVLTKNGKQVVI